MVIDGFAREPARVRQSHVSFIFCILRRFAIIYKISFLFSIIIIVKPRQIMKLLLLLASLVVVSVTAFIPSSHFESGLSCVSRRPHPLGPQIICKPQIDKTICLPAVPEAESSTDNDADDLFDIKTTIFLVGGQSLLVGVAAVLAVLLNVPNYGLGASIEFSSSSIQQGFLTALPLGLFVFILDRLEDRIPALKGTR